MNYDPWTRRLVALSALLLTVLILLTLLLSGRTPSINDRLDRIEQHQVFQSCLLLIPVEQRGEAAVSECVAPDLAP
jgi:hypothetical protein